MGTFEVTITSVIGMDDIRRYEIASDTNLMWHVGEHMHRLSVAEVDEDGNVRVFMVRRTKPRRVKGVLESHDFRNGAGVWIDLDDVPAMFVIAAVINAVETTNTGERSHNDTPWTPDVPTDDQWSRGETVTVLDLRPGDVVEVGRRPGVVPGTETVVDVRLPGNGTVELDLSDSGTWHCSVTAEWRLVDPQTAVEDTEDTPEGEDTGETISVCQGCFHAVAYGECEGCDHCVEFKISGDHQSDPCRALWLAQCQRWAGAGVTLVAGDVEYGFRTTECEGCGDGAHGDRFEVTVMRDTHPVA